jgi:2-polyprenyl-3-methyl-5-hydroxy-6-metoxy-1,4-benzoquinol methylase
MSNIYNKWDIIYQKNPLNTLGWELGKPRPILVKILQKGLITKGKALDICCGAGTNSIYLAKKGFQVTGIDISSIALQYALEKTREENLLIDLIKSSFVNLSFRGEIFDFIFDMGCFHHVAIDDRPSFIRGVYQVMKKKRIIFNNLFQ